jgi:hypothetical protein
MPDLAMDEHGGEPRAVSRRAFLSTGAAGMSAAALVPGAPDATAQTGGADRSARKGRRHVVEPRVFRLCRQL